MTGIKKIIRRSYHSQFGESFRLSCQLLNNLSKSQPNIYHLCWSFKFKQWVIQTPITFDRLKNALELEIYYTYFP